MFFLLCEWEGGGYYTISRFGTSSYRLTHYHRILGTYMIGLRSRFTGPVFFF